MKTMAIAFIVLPFLTACMASTTITTKTSEISREEIKLLKINNAAIHYETAGDGQPIVFIHAGVADSRQWNNEFKNFSDRYKVIRYDLRGYGNSDPVAGEFTHLGDLEALIDHLDITQPVILVGCSMGGGLALDYALENPEKVKALVLVDSAPSGLKVDVPTPAKFAQVDAAEEAGDLDLVAELETQIWFDGTRDTADVNQKMRQLAYDMNLNVLRQDTKQLGERVPNMKSSAVNRLAEVQIPVLGIIGANDIPYMHAATDHMADFISNFRKVTIENAAHLPNLDQPDKFRVILASFFENSLEMQP